MKSTTATTADFLGTADAVVDCGSCTACCHREIVMLTPGENPDDYPGVELKRNPLNGEPAYMLPHKADHSCLYLGDQGCTIYEKRPRMCRAFSCVGFFERALETMTRNERRRMLKNKNFDPVVWEAGRSRSKKKDKV